MEAATISSPQRKLNAVPVQKSLSLPSYARAGGEGIDHRIIFAALEQKEKIRRKSRIFAREKSARQNIFCLPISSGNKCRETSLSSDTSCSSLEYQKPKVTPKPKKDDKKPANETTVIEIKTAKTSQSEVKSNQSQNVEQKIVEVEPETQKNSLKFELRKGHRSPSDTLRLNVNSSDSMERSSRSSNDSLSRKERLVAIKAKVEAAREKIGDTSSEDENHNSITRYNSDGVIHRSVREVKSRSYRMEKRLRRRSQDEYGLKKAHRKNNLSLCLNSLEDGIKLDLDRSLNIFDDSQNMECKTDFCPSPNMLDFTKKSYFSDFPSRENVSRSVQARVRHIEEEERKRRNSSDFRDKTKISPRQSPQNTENSSPFSTQRQNAFSNQNVLGSLDMEKSSPSSDVVLCPSPVGRAPTPPPRSPKSITFINKVYKQHQNSYLNHNSHSLERKLYFQPNIPVTSQPKYTDKANSSDSKTCLDLFEDTKERRKMRELFNARRKTCSYFDYTDNYAFKELNSSIDKTEPKSPMTTTGLNIPQSTETKDYFSSSETPCALSEDPKRRFWRSKWGEAEKRHEFMFNSLESKKKSPSWMKWSEISQEKEQCLCQIVSGSKYCTCSNSRKNRDSKLCTSSSISDKIESTSKNVYVNNANQSFRLSKSEMNIAYVDQTKSNSENLLRDLATFKSLRDQQELTEKNSATANLDSAMEELESVYRSLKFSSDNLSVKNSTSNLSLNNLNAETSKNDVTNQKTNDLHFKQCSMRENNFNLYNSKLSNSKTASDKKPLESLKLSVYSPTPEVSSSSLCKSPETESICIDELFNDLTRQLDIEQKLLKESRENRQENKTPDLQNRRDNRSFDFQTEKCEKRDQKRMTPLESIVSIRKELFDNLQKNSQEQIRSYSPGSKLSDKTDSYQLEIAKKKYKAVRSLSENISYLMASTNPNPIVKKIPISKAESCNSNMELILEKSTPKQYEHVVLEPHKIENKKEAFLNHPVVPKRTYMPDKHKKPVVEEIRQIRVSMDSNSSDSANILKKEYGEYPRLTSAVCRPQLSPKIETTPRLPPRGNSPSSCKETADLLDENGLEKLLNTLLNDVPDPKQSSLMKSREDAPPTPPPVSSAGEMRVMQHLDILRLKPIPS